jgi:DNA-binding Lrp family transcriptional regulator
MTDKTLDRFDLAILAALQENATRTNGELADLVHLSASQCSRRRARLEANGTIAGYTARLDPAALGYSLRAIMRINLVTHSKGNADSFAGFLARCPEVQAAFSVSGDADYVLIVLARDLAAFAEFVHGQVLPHPLVTQVRSEIVLTTLKEATGIPVL